MRAIFRSQFARMACSILCEASNVGRERERDLSDGGELSKKTPQWKKKARPD